MPKQDITRDNTVDTFLKAYGAAEVTQKARALFIERFNALAETTAQKAIAAASLDAPTKPRVDVAHLQKAFEGLGWSTAAGDLDPAAILARLHELPPEKIGLLVRLIQDWLRAQGSHA